MRWTDINWQKGYIDLKKQLLHINQKYVFVELKTQKATRKIYLDEGLIRELRDWKIYQEFYAEMLGDKFNNENNLLFTNTFGGPVNVQNFKRRYYFKMLAAAGIKKGFNIHSMRHPYVKHTTKKYNSEKQKTQATKMDLIAWVFRFCIFNYSKRSWIL